MYPGDITPLLHAWIKARSTWRGSHRRAGGSSFGIIAASWVHTARQVPVGWDADQGPLCPLCPLCPSAAVLHVVNPRAGEASAGASKRLKPPLTQTLGHGGRVTCLSRGPYFLFLLERERERAKRKKKSDAMCSGQIAKFARKWEAHKLRAWCLPPSFHRCSTPRARRAVI